MTDAISFVNLLVQVGFIWLAFRAIQGIHLETMWNRPPRTLALLITLLSIAIDEGCASFVISFFTTLRNLLLTLK